MPNHKGGLVPPDEPMEAFKPEPAELKLRDAPQKEDHKLRAQQRMAEIRSNFGEQGFDEGIDEFHIALSEIPEGWSYEWKMESVLGRVDPAYETALRRKGWFPVPTSRHPSYMPVGTPGQEPIRRKGMILMERPMELTLEARGIELTRARNQVRQKEAQLNAAPPGTFDRDNKGAPMGKIGKEMVPMEVPEK